MQVEKAGRRKKRSSGGDNLQNFKYVDVLYLNPQTGARSKWIRVTQGLMVEDFRNKHGNYNVFATIQSYANKVKRAGGGEEMYAPLFFDIDSARPLARDTKGSEGLIGLGAIHTTEQEKLSTMLPKELIAHILNYAMGIPISDEVCIRINA